MNNNSITQLPFNKEWAVTINCGTRLSTTLTILSALRYVDMPLLVIDCPINQNNADFDYLCKLKEQYNFTLIQLPLRKHGDTLDYIFQNIPADYVLLLDSDLEVLNSDGLKLMRLYMGLDKAFGSGYTHGPFTHVNGIRNGYYAERMWIPNTFLNVNIVKQAINSGESFNIVKIWNDFPLSQKISVKIYKYFTKYKVINCLFNIFRKRYGEMKPSYVLFDTGANIYKYLKRHGYFFVGPTTIVRRFYSAHYDGITRRILSTDDSTATDINDVDMIIKERLQKEYNFNFEKKYKNNSNEKH